MYGTVKVYWGTMFAGKTTKLINDLIQAGDGAICFKPKQDTRYEEGIIRTHDGAEFPAIVVENAEELFKLVLADLNRITTVGIEEASLFSDDEMLVDVVRKLRELGKNVIITGLDMDVHGEPFGAMPYLAAIADECYKLKAICSCGKPASNQIYFGTDGNMIGGSDKYKPACWQCYYGYYEKIKLPSS